MDDYEDDEGPDGDCCPWREPADKPIGEYVWCAVCGHFIQFVHVGRPQTMECPNRCTVTVQVPKMSGFIRNLKDVE